VLAKHFLKYIPVNEIKRAALNTLYNNKATELEDFEISIYQQSNKYIKIYI
jgi:hypothetical protein